MISNLEVIPISDPNSLKYKKLKANAKTFVCLFLCVHACLRRAEATRGWGSLVATHHGFFETESLTETSC